MTDETRLVVHNGEHVRIAELDYRAILPMAARLAAHAQEAHARYEEAIQRLMRVRASFRSVYGEDCPAGICNGGLDCDHIVVVYPTP